MTVTRQGYPTEEKLVKGLYHCPPVHEVSLTQTAGFMWAPGSELEPNGNMYISVQGSSDLGFSISY